LDKLIQQLNLDVHALSNSNHNLLLVVIELAIIVNFVPKHFTISQEFLMPLPPLSLYVHLPWCVQKCPYCDFNSHTAPANLPEQQYVAALLRDLDAELPMVQGRSVDSVFLGGGTPSLFSVTAMANLLQGISRRIQLTTTVEITLEANPGAFEQARFAGYLEVGVNRFSLGIQSFQDKYLQALGRIHTAKQGHDAIVSLLQLGCERINLDIMYGLPGQTQQQSQEDLLQALTYGVQHISWYQLTLEPNTEFYLRPPSLPNEDMLADMQLEGQLLLTSANLQQYEVSAFAQTGAEARHNLNYWHFGDYLGIGAGAHGKISHNYYGQFQVQRRVKLRQPKAYMVAIDALSSAVTVTREDLPLEFFINALRLYYGVDSQLFTQRTGLPIQSIATPLQKARQAGLMESNRLRATALGWRYLDDLLTYFQSTG
jgi:putative oxygen-independent coproporphyrinogen III oxidase